MLTYLVGYKQYEKKHNLARISARTASGNKIKYERRVMGVRRVGKIRIIR